MSKKKATAISYKLALLALSSVLSLGLAEIGLRASSAFEMRSIRFEHVRLSENPVLMYELDPEHERHSSQGFRGAEFSRERRENTFRILVLGDSIAYGLEVSEPETLPRHLQAALEARFLPGAEDVEVLNLAVPGYSIIQEAELLARKGVALDPQLVVLVVCLNDWDPSAVEFDQLLASEDASRRGFLSRFYDPGSSGFSRVLNRSHLYRALAYQWKRWGGVWDPPEWSRTVELWPGAQGVEDTVVRQHYAGEEFYQAHFQRLVGLLSAREIPLVVLVIPYAGSRYVDYYHRRVKQLESLSAPGGITVVDFLGQSPEAARRIRGGEEPSRLFLRDALHLSDEGNRLAAEAVAVAIAPTLEGWGAARGSAE